MALVGEQRSAKPTKSQSGCGVTARGYKGRPPPTGQGKANKRDRAGISRRPYPEAKASGQRQGAKPDGRDRFSVANGLGSRALGARPMAGQAPKW